LEIVKPTEKIEHLNLALRAIRNVNRLLVKEKKRDLFLKGICDILIENRSYDKVWLCVLDDSGNLDTYAESGIGSDFIPLIERFKSGKIFNCAQRAFKQTEPVLIKNPFFSCTDCPLSLKSAGWGTITVKLIHDDKLYGLLSVSIPKELVANDVEQAIMKEIAGDIAFGLYRIKQKEEHKKADAALKGRVKELNYLFGFSRLIEKVDVSIDEILQSAVDLIPSAMQFPEITCAQVVIDGQKFQTTNYKETSFKILNSIIFHGKKIGALTVCHLKKPSGTETKHFLKEEEKLITSVALRIGKTIERKRDRKALEESEKRLRSLVENSLTCISIIQDNRIVYQNPEYMRLFGPSQKAFILSGYDNIHPDDIEHVKNAITKFISEKDKNMDIEFRLYPPKKRKSRIEIKWIYCRLSLIEFYGKEAMMVNLMDISHAKKLEHLLRVQDKMTSLGRVAAGIAHEIRNPLSGINIYLKAMEKICTKNENHENENHEKVNKILSQLQSASNKIESVIKRVMDFSQPGEPRFTPININKPVKEAVKLSFVTLRKSGVQININITQNLPDCNADAHMIEQVMLNLITNASEAMKNINTEKKIEISTFLKNNYVCINVRDSGPGIPEYLMDTVFDPFYTTKSYSSGIGLSISQRIVTDHNGFLDVSISEFGGAEFLVKIPATQLKKLI